MPALLFAVACAAGLVLLGDLRAQAWTAIAVLLAWGVGGLALHRMDLGRAAHGGSRVDVRRLSPWQVLVAALLVRLPLLATEPGLSDDLYRYMWEGWLTLHGGNPYATPPAVLVDPALEHPVRALVNHPEVSTIYPPVALWFFALLAALGMSTLVFQAAMGLADAGIAAVLAAILRGRGRSTSGAWLYAVLPLGAVESASSGHLEPLAVLGLVLAVLAWDRGSSGLGWAGLGALVKLLPAVLVPTLWRRQPWLILAVAGLGLLSAWPFLDAGPALVRGFGTYAEHWSFNASLFRLLSGVGDLVGLTPTAVRLVGVALGAAVTAAALWRFRDPARVALWVGAAFVLLSPTVHPWYLLWVWVPALVCGTRAWTVLVVLAPVSYAALASFDPASGSWQEPWWPAPLQYLGLSLALAAEWLWHLTRPGPWQPSPAPTRVETPPPTLPDMALPAASSPASPT